ncbi:MAG TPA: hypothetical protein PLZ72_14705 [Microthrixaceae bacterium]|nr:hypothetical protein [Microthrixaceae bacterium]
MLIYAEATADAITVTATVTATDPATGDSVTLTTRGPGAAAIVRDIPRWWPDALDRIVEELGA